MRRTTLLPWINVGRFGGHRYHRATNELKRQIAAEGDLPDGAIYLRSRDQCGTIHTMEKRQLTLWGSATADDSDYSVPRDDVRELQADTRNDLYVPLKKVVVVRQGCILSRPVVSSSADAIRLFRDYWEQQEDNDQERFAVACLNTKNRVQSILQITTGTLDASLVHPREVFKPAILQGSASVILSHNHPSGDATPSREDH